MKKIFVILLILLSGSTFGQIQTFYVKPSGNDSNSGADTTNAFRTWQKGVSVATPGDTVYFMDGVYMSTGVVFIDPTGYYNGYYEGSTMGVSGKVDSFIHYFAYPGAEPILDCTYHCDSTAPNYNNGIHMFQVEYLHFRGLTVRNVAQCTSAISYGFNYESTANIITERCVSHNINGAGFRGSSGAWNLWDGANPVFSSDTSLWINCDAYNLCDSSTTYLGDPTPGNAGDGWKTHNYENNYFSWEGCRAWNYADDGFDPSGSGERVLNNNWAMSLDTYREYANSMGYYETEGNGFKTTGFSYDWRETDTLLIDEKMVKVTNCIAAFCQVWGFYNNYGPGQNNGLHYNNIAWGCGYIPEDGAGWFDAYGTSADTVTTIYRNNISFNSNYQIYAALAYYVQSTNSWVPYAGHPYYQPNPAFTVTTSDFLVSDSATIVSQLTAARKADGSLPDITAFHLAEGSDLIDAGTYVGMSATPDVGIDWEYLGSDSIGAGSNDTDIYAVTASGIVGSASINTTNHTATITVNRAEDINMYTLNFTLATGATINPGSGVSLPWGGWSRVYTVTAEDAVTEQAWTVTIEKAPSPVRVTKADLTEGKVELNNGRLIKYK